MSSRTASMPRTPCHDICIDSLKKKGLIRLIVEYNPVDICKSAAIVTET
jgi:hypothetical protein